MSNTVKKVYTQYDRLKELAIKNVLIKELVKKLDLKFRE